MFRQRILMWGLLVAFLLGSATSSEALPDLVVSKLLGPATVKLGDAFYLAVTVKNQGTDPSGPTRVVFYFSTDSTINTSDYLISYYCPIQGLGPGEESPPLCVPLLSTFLLSVSSLAVWDLLSWGNSG